MKWLLFTVLTGLPVLCSAEPAAQSDLSDVIKWHIGLLEGLDPASIHVETNQGSAVLSGTVDNLLRAERALRVAQSIKGVREVVDNLSATPLAPRPDSKIKKDIEESFRMNSVLANSNIHVAVEDQKAVLTGTVNSFAEKALAKEIAKRIRGLSGLEMAIHVNGTEKRMDQDIRKNIQQILRTDAWLHDDPIEVRVRGGRAVISGTVGSPAEQIRAASKSWIVGVTSVSAGGLSVRPEKEGHRAWPATLSNRRLLAAVQESLRWNHRFSDGRPKISSHRRIVTLTGPVPTLAIKRAVEEDVRGTLGVVDVKNQLRVLESGLSDQEIAVSLRRALEMDATIEPDEVRVSVQEGKVILEGSVDNRFEKNHAEAIALQIRGAREVDNRIAIGSPPPLKSDPDIERDLKSLWRWNALVRSDTMSAVVKNGVVILKGNAASWPERDQIIESCWMAGARDVVDSELKVGAPVSRSASGS